MRTPQERLEYIPTAIWRAAIDAAKSNLRHGIGGGQFKVLEQPILGADYLRLCSFHAKSVTPRVALRMMRLCCMKNQMKEEPRQRKGAVAVFYFPPEDAIYLHSLARAELDAEGLTVGIHEWAKDKSP